MNTNIMTNEERLTAAFLLCRLGQRVRARHKGDMDYVLHLFPTGVEQQSPSGQLIVWGYYEFPDIPEGAEQWLLTGMPVKAYDFDDI